MPSEESRRLRAVYADALRRDPEERDEYLDKACADEPQLKAKVAALLKAHSQDFLEVDLAPPPPQMVDRPEDIEGTIIGPYIVRRELGRGGMGVVYLADDTRLARRVALKAITPGLGQEPGGRERLRHEARAAAGLSHPGIATVYALEEIGNELYLACEYVPGDPLRAILASGPLPIPQVVTIGAQLARALAAAHTLGVVHRDIKPENVVKTPSGAVKVLDFGLARMENATHSRLTQTGVIMGTPAYMAPEQALGQHVDSRTDLFALGLLLYELAAGVNPFIAKTVTATIARIVEEEPPLLSAVRPDSVPELDRIVATCLRKDPAERYASTQELVADFEQLEAEMGVVRLRSSDRSGQKASAAHRTKTTTQSWWELHQLIVSTIYILMIYPAWHVQRFLTQPWGMLFLLAVLAPAAAGTSLRLHLSFIARNSPDELEAQRAQSRKLTRYCDVAFAASQIIGALSIGQGHPEFAMLFVTVAMAIVVAALVIEPATERAAFGQ